MTTTDAPPPRRLLRHPLVRLAVSGGILTLLLVALPFGEIRDALGRVSVATWLIALALYLALHVIGIAKWRMVVNAANGGLSFHTAVRAYYMGLFGSTFLPSLVGGDVVRAGVAMREVRSKTGLVLGSLVDRLQDVIGLTLVAGVGVLLSPRALDADTRRIFVMVAALLGTGGAAAAALLLLTRVGRFPWKIRRKLVQVRAAVRASASQPGALAAALLAGMLLQGLQVGLNWWLGTAIGITAPLYVWLFVWPLAKIAALVPLTQNGIGVREAAFVALSAPFGIAPAHAVAASLVFQVVVIVGGLVGGFIAWLLGRSSASRPQVSVASSPR
jgi:uncharacterized membrane protein YbhN (UPF0104 family)